MHEHAKVVNLLNRGLPKWPQMVVTGVPVTVEQAKEIIRRTDLFFQHGYGGNDHKYNLVVKLLLGMPVYKRKHSLDSMVATDLGIDLPEAEDWKQVYQAENLWRARWGVVDTSYVNNCWLSSAFIFGPHGWCHPDGQIGYLDNVGKWPSVEEVFNDWQVLAQAFPYLDVGVTLMSGEGCEDNIEPVVSMIVKGGEVTLVEPGDHVHEGHVQPHIDRGFEGAAADLSKPPRLREHGIPNEWLLEWAETHRPDDRHQLEFPKDTDLQEILEQVVSQ